MNKYPNVWRLAALLSKANQVGVGIDGKNAPARPLGFQSIGNRIHCAWLVFTGRADAVVWPEDEWDIAGSAASAALAACTPAKSEESNNG